MENNIQNNEDKPKFVLDKDSVEFLESRFDAKLDPVLQDDKDYYRAIFYFKCLGLKNDYDGHQRSAEEKEFSQLYSIKERIDNLFEEVYPVAVEFNKLVNKIDDAVNNGQMPSDEDMLKLQDLSAIGPTAITLTINDRLYPKLSNPQNSNDVTTNGHLTATASYQVFCNFFSLSSPELANTLNQRYNAMEVQAVAHISPYISDIETFMPVIKEHPKAVLALGITAKANKEAGFSVGKIASPEDLKMMCKFQRITEIADMLSFKNLTDSMDKAYANVKVTIGLGRQQNNTVTPSRKVYGE